MTDDVKIVRPDAPRDVVSHQGTRVITGPFSVTTGVRATTGPVVDRDSTCGTRSTHCWHDSGHTLTSYPGYRVHNCCHCGSLFHEPIPMPKVSGHHGPYLNGGRADA